MKLGRHLSFKRPIKLLDSNTKYSSARRRKSKYGNKPICGCDSKAEYRRYCYLKILNNRGLISDLRKHVMYFFKHGAYEADFVYTEKGETIVEDVKHPLLLRARKFKTNQKKMMEEYGLYIYPIKPSRVNLRRSAAVYKGMDKPK